MRNESAPQWIKLWIEKYCDDICLEDIEELYPTDEEETELVIDVGKAFISALSYYKSQITGEEYRVYKMSRDAKRLYNSFVKDIDQSFKEYEKKAEINRENGKKGGRPPKSDKVIDLAEAEQTRKEQEEQQKEQQVSDFHRMLDRYREERNG